MNIKKINQWILNFCFIGLFYFGKPITYFKFFWYPIYFFDLVFVFLFFINLKTIVSRKIKINSSLSIYFILILYLFFRLENLNFTSLRNGYIFIAVAWYFLIIQIKKYQIFNFKIISKSLNFYGLFSLPILLLTRQDIVGLFKIELPFNEITLFTQKYNYILIKAGIVICYQIIYKNRKLLENSFNLTQLSFIISIITICLGITQSRVGFLVSTIIIFLTFLIKSFNLGIFRLIIFSVAISFLALPLVNFLSDEIIINDNGKQLNNLKNNCTYPEFYIFKYFGNISKNSYCEDLDLLAVEMNADLGKLYFRGFDYCEILNAMFINLDRCKANLFSDIQSILKNSNQESLEKEVQKIISSTNLQENSISWRESLWKALIMELKSAKKYIFGIGFDKSIPEYLNLNLNIYSIKSAHNSYLSIIGWSGLVGFCLFTFLLTSIFKTESKGNLFFKIFFFSYLTAALFDQTFETPSNSILFWIFIGLNFKDKY